MGGGAARTFRSARPPPLLIRPLLHLDDLVRHEPAARARALAGTETSAPPTPAGAPPRRGPRARGRTRHPVAGLARTGNDTPAGDSPIVVAIEGADRGAAAREPHPERGEPLLRGRRDRGRSHAPRARD